MSKEPYDWLVKVIVLGDSSVGKTNILTQYCDGKFSQSYMATIGVDFKLKTLTVEEKKIKLQIWDTAGQERFRNITQTYYKGAFGIIFVYSIVDRESFNNIEKWVKSIKDNTTTEVCSVLVANKSDCEADRRVSVADGEALAIKFGMPFIETSAKEGTNIQQLFELLGRDLKKRLDKEDLSKNTISQGGVGLDQAAKTTEASAKQCAC